MKVKIGKYKDYVGPYQIAEALCFWAPKTTDEFGFKEYPKWVNDFGEWLSNTWVMPVCEWVESKRHRTIKIRVDDYDTWSADHTLALIIHATLVEFRNSKRYGVPGYNTEDTVYLSDDSDYEGDAMELKVKEWNKILDKMIWSFDAIINEANHDNYWEETPDRDKWKIHLEKLKKHNEKIQEGLDLFGKHFRNLWD